MSPSAIASKAIRHQLFRLPRFRAGALVALAALSLACAGDDGPRVPLNQVQGQSGTLPPGHPQLDGTPAISVAARSALDSGNAAFRQKNYDGALRFYRDAARAAPNHASPWFGIFMVAEATGNTALRDSAKREVQKRTVDPPGVTDSTLRNTHPKTAS
jgi:hypothetical protein